MWFPYLFLLGPSVHVRPVWSMALLLCNSKDRGREKVSLSLSVILFLQVRHSNEFAVKIIKGSWQKRVSLCHAFAQEGGRLYSVILKIKQIIPSTGYKSCPSPCTLEFHKLFLSSSNAHNWLQCYADSLGVFEGGNFNACILQEVIVQLSLCVMACWTGQGDFMEL